MDENNPAHAKKCSRIEVSVVEGVGGGAKKETLKRCEEHINTMLDTIGYNEGLWRRMC